MTHFSGSILIKNTMDKATEICVFLLLGVASACELTPGIFITPLSLEGLTGSCLHIPCNFRVSEGQDFPGLDSVAVWIIKQSKFVRPNSEFVVFNGSTSPYYPMEITGDLNKKDCTTLFSNLKREFSDNYFFRVEDGEFKSTASCDPIHITVRDSAWSPSIEVSGEQTEAEVVTITCSAVTPCPHAPPQLTWDLHQDTPHRTVKNPDGTFNTIITHELTLTSSHDGYNVTCSAAYPVNGEVSPKHVAMTTITLNVTRRGPSCVIQIGAFNIVKLSGIILLFSSLIIFECWLKAAYGKNPEQRPEPIYVNQVIESQT